MKKYITLLCFALATALTSSAQMDNPSQHGPQGVRRGVDTSMINIVDIQPLRVGIGYDATGMANKFDTATAIGTRAESNTKGDNGGKAVVTCVFINKKHVIFKQGQFIMSGADYLKWDDDTYVYETFLPTVIPGLRVK